MLIRCTSSFSDNNKPNCNNRWLLRETKRSLLSRDLQVRELEKLLHLMTQIVNNTLLAASIKAMKVPDEHRAG